jgi:glycosyltransferase A (GT-A) superfamily protein (DUF2064 family)
MHLTIIAKTPEPGRVKTRLCPPCTAKQAAEIAAAALADTVDAIDATVGVSPWVGLVRRVLLLDGRADEWIPDGYDVVTQRGDGLAERLANGFADLGPGGGGRDGHSCRRSVARRGPAHGGSGL